MIVSLRNIFFKLLLFEHGAIMKSRLPE